MSSKEQKESVRSAKCPMVDQNLPSDDLQNPDPVTADDITRSFLAQRKQFEKDIHAYFRSLNANFHSIFEAQQKSSHHLCPFQLPAQQAPLPYLSSAPVQVICSSAVLDPGNRAETGQAFRNFWKAMDLQEHRKAFIGGEESEVKKEISKAQDRVIMETPPSSSVRVPFMSAVEADMARRSLVANAQHQLLVPQEYTVNGSTLFVSVFPKPGVGVASGLRGSVCSRGVLMETLVGYIRWTTDDTSLFQISINSFLDQPSVVRRNIRNSQFVAGVKRGRGRIHHT
ncbi:hypothetical protein LEMLEM_LOCUS17398 [Lemmus lemmus]